MKALALPSIGVSGGGLGHAAQLAIAVVVSWSVSAACGLPENLWAVMSALIVLRPTAGSTLGAGWDRVRGTLVGTAVGLAGVWIGHGTTTILAIVAILAFASALVPALRSAPIAALIVLSSAGIPGHSAVDVAELRAVEIAIGVATGVLVSLFAFAVHARDAFDRAAAAWLRAAVDADAESSRTRLRALAVLAVGADREAVLMRWLGRERPTVSGFAALSPTYAPSSGADRIRQARLLARTGADLNALWRALDADPVPADAARRRAVNKAVADALAATAPTFETDALDRAALRGLKALADEPRAWLAPHARLLLQDLAALARLRTDTHSTETP